MPLVVMSTSLQRLQDAQLAVSRFDAVLAQARADLAAAEADRSDAMAELNRAIDAVIAAES